MMIKETKIAPKFQPAFPTMEIGKTTLPFAPLEHGEMRWPMKELENFDGSLFRGLIENVFDNPIESVFFEVVDGKSLLSSSHQGKHSLVRK